MGLVWIVAVVAVAFALGCVVVGAAAARRSRSEPEPLEWLVGLRSASGKRFFPSKESARELMTTLEDVPELSPQETERRDP